MIEEFTAYMNGFYGINGTYSSGRDLTPIEVADAVIKLLSGKNPEHPNHAWGGGNDFDREIIRDMLFTEDEQEIMYARTRIYRPKLQSQ
ncbi:hypothetical protein [Neptuniibacter sp. QD37_11]|uniref:hypothetical protein n=1 Tax=Neptuniibacter sp. QD37_11 TaxID=3398209 RepID=UPI0039F50F21